MKSDDEIKEDLTLHLAKTILSGGISTRDSIKQIVVTLCTTSIPAYLALLKFFEEQVKDLNLFLVLLPLTIWLVSLFLAVILLRTSLTYVDFKNPQKIISSHANSTRRHTRLGLVFAFTSFIGILIAAFLFY